MHGIGPKKAKLLVEDHGIENVETLINRANDPLLELTNAQKAGLRYYNDFNTSIPRKEMQKHRDFMQTLIEPISKFAIAGSFRRGKASSNDIDVLLTGDINQLVNVLETLKKKGYLVPDAELANGVL